MGKNTYLQEVYSRIFRMVKITIGKYGIFYITANIVGTALYFLIQTYRLGKTGAGENLIDGLILLGAINGVLLILVPPYVRFWVIPEEIYSIQQNEIQQKADEIAKLTIERKPLNLSVAWGRLLSTDVGGGIPRVTITLDIVNNETRKILDLEAYLIVIEQMTEELPDDWSYTRGFGIYRTLRLEWKGREYSIDLAPGFPETYVQIASLDCSLPEFKFTHEGIKRRIQELQKDALYKILVQFKGRLDGNDPDYRFFHHEAYFVCSPTRCQIGSLTRENSNQNLPDWLRDRINLTLKTQNSSEEN